MKNLKRSAIPFYQVEVDDIFWKPRIETNRTVTIPDVFAKCEKEGRLKNFERAADPSQGPYIGVMPFEDTDVYKAIEAASYSLKGHYDESLDQYLDNIIALIADAQESDGYLYTNRTIDPDHVHKFAGPERWSSLVQSHELYDSGHLYEAACAHYLSTGKRTLLDIALKNADLICSVFGAGKREDAPGHEEVEIGLIKLFHVTGEKKYLELARFFLEQRGNHANRPLYQFEENPKYSQDHIPVTDQKEAAGHAVRAAYLYSAMADLAPLIERNEPYTRALDAIWHNMVEKRIYLTGGIGARHKGEAFGEDYELPNLTAYNETCAAIGSIMWNHRMFLLTGSGLFYDILEQTLYNGFLSGVSLSGDKFFYPNPLESDGEYKFNFGNGTRAPWFDVSCCPTNISRFFPSLPGYIYASESSGGELTDLYVELYIQSKTAVKTSRGMLNIAQETSYPWDGTVRITLGGEDEGPALPLSVHLRIPGWTRGNIMGGKLYGGKVQDDIFQDIRCEVNGELVPSEIVNGHLVIDRNWTLSDAITLYLPMPVMEISCDENVIDNRGKKAIQRGPIVYCAEQRDNSVDVDQIRITDLKGAHLRTGHRDFPKLDKIVVIEGENTSLIPYYLWSNRGEGKMKVWLKE